MSSELILYKTLSGLSIPASILPLIWHAKTGNIPAVCLITWIGVFNTISFVNAFIWGDNIFTAWEGRVFCDIQIKFLIAAAAGKMGSIAAITRNLAYIMRDDLPVMKTRAAKRRQLIEDLIMSFGISIWMMGIHYVVQPDRYWLIEVAGCVPSIDNSWPSIVLVFIWPPIIALVATYYCILVLVRLRRYRHEFEKILSNNSGNTTKSRFFRLYVYCCGLTLCLFPTTYYIFYRNLKVDRLPYDWSAIHDPYEWSYIFKVPNKHVPFDKWIAIGAGLILFFFFGVGRDAVLMYKSWMHKFGLYNHWERMKKRREKRKGNASNSSGWSGSTRVGRATIRDFMTSAGDRDDSSEITTVYVDDEIKTWKHKKPTESLPSKLQILDTTGSQPSSNPVTPTHLFTSRVPDCNLATPLPTYSFQTLHINQSLSKPDAMPASTTDISKCGPTSQKYSANISIGSGSVQGDMPSSCMVPAGAHR